MDPMLERAAWLDAELAGCTFADVRLGKRLRTLLERLGGRWRQSAPRVPGLGGDEGRLSVLHQSARQRDADPGWPFGRHPQPAGSGGQCDPHPA